MNIGIFGGSFNPPHTAHLIHAELLRDMYNLETVLFIPSAVPPHKKNEDLLEPEHRLRLTQLAVAGNPGFEVSDIEIRRDGPSYMVDTIFALDKIYKNDTLYLIVGIDNLVAFHQWKEYRKILGRCVIVAMNRPGFSADRVREDVLEQTRIADVPYIDISSTEIRKRIRDGKSVRYMVPDAVLLEIEKNGFYKYG